MTFGARAMAPPGDCGKPDMAIAHADDAAARYGGEVGKIALQDAFYIAIMFVARAGKKTATISPSLSGKIPDICWEWISRSTFLVYS